MRFLRCLNFFLTLLVFVLLPPRPRPANAFMSGMPMPAMACSGSAPAFFIAFILPIMPMPAI